MSAPDLSPRFYDEWVALARRQGVDPLDLARVSFAETGMYRRHPRNPRAGVWPFIESTLRRQGWQGSGVDFTALDPVDQILPWLEDYLRPYAGLLRDEGMVYVAMFLPAHLRRASQSNDAYVLTRAGEPSRFYEQNTILDRDGDGAIDVGDLRRHIAIMTGMGGARWQAIEGELRARGAGGSPVTRVASAARRGLTPLLLAAAAAGAWYLYYTTDGRRLRQRAERRADRLLASL